MKPLLLVALASFGLAGGSGPLTHEQALDSAFPKQKMASKSHYWSKEERAHLASLAGVKKVPGTATSWHVAPKDDLPPKAKTKVGKQAWFDKRAVRSKAQDLMVVIDADGKVTKIVVCRFDEPQDYRPSQKWYDQFVGETLDDDLQIGKDIHAVSGATMTARATTAAVRELLAADQVARHGVPKPKPVPAAKQD